MKEWKGELVFLHEVGAGAGDRSYGIHVARLAGLPLTVLKRAEEVLSKLEQEKSGGAVQSLAESLPLFAFKAEDVKSNEPQISAVEEALGNLDIDSLSPRQALEEIYKLREKMSN